jgi:putative flippase GtrA
MIISKQLFNFLLIGSITVLIDFLTYRGVVVFYPNISFAKSLGFAFGTGFSFFANRNITFKVRNDIWSHLSKFAILYFMSLVINVLINGTSLDFFSKSDIKVQISFILATSITATINYTGMKYLVFR